MIELTNGHQEVRRVREFLALEAIEESKMLRISYRETVYIDGELTSVTTRSYNRDYDYWKSSELGVEIMAMVNADLQQADPSVPRDI
jgi:hypothetical protein